MSTPRSRTSSVATTQADEFEMRGRVMAGWLRVSPEHLGAVTELAKWVELRRGLRSVAASEEEVVQAVAVRRTPVAGSCCAARSRRSQDSSEDPAGPTPRVVASLDHAESDRAPKQQDSFIVHEHAQTQLVPALPSEVVLDRFSSLATESQSS